MDTLKSLVPEVFTETVMPFMRGEAIVSLLSVSICHVSNPRQSLTRGFCKKVHVFSIPKTWMRCLWLHSGVVQGWTRRRATGTIIAEREHRVPVYLYRTSRFGRQFDNLEGGTVILGVSTLGVSVQVEVQSNITGIRITEMELIPCCLPPLKVGHATPYL